MSTTTAVDDISISARLSAAPTQLTDALSSGNPTSVADFMEAWTLLVADVDSAIDQQRLTVRTVSLARTISQTVHALATRFGAIERMSNSVRADLRRKIMASKQPSSEAPSSATAPKSVLPFEWIRPVLDYISDHICSPYPPAEEKMLLLEQCASAGWTSITQRKLEDWLNTARCKMGYTFILKSDDVDEDRHVMENYVRRVLFGGPEARDSIPVAIVRRIEMMQQWVHRQYEFRAAKDQTSSWAHDLVDLVQRLSVPDDVGPDADCGDEEVDSDDSDMGGFTFSDSDSDSDSDTLYSDSDAEDDALPASVLGAKRKYPGLGLGQPPARTVSRTSSNSSLSSHRTLGDAPLEVCVARCPAVPLDNEDDCDRPAKRRRCLLDDSSEATPAPTAVAESPPAKTQLVDQPYRSQKRKRMTSEDESSSSPSKRPRQPDPLPSTQVPITALDALASMCRLDWDASLPAAEVDVDVDLDWDGDLPQPSLLDDDPSVDESFGTAVASPNEPSDTFMDISFAWCSLHVYMLERMLRHGVHIVPSPDASPRDPTPSITVDASLFNPEELAYLSSLSMQDPDVGQACVEPLEPGPNCPDVLGLSPWSADLSDPSPSDGTTLPSVDIDEWITSLLNEPFST